MEKYSLGTQIGPLFEPKMFTAVLQCSAGLSKAGIWPKSTSKLGLLAASVQRLFKEF